MKKFLILIVVVCLAQLSAYEMNRLIDSPTAGILQKGESELSAKIYKNNGLIVGAKVGLFPRFMFGFNYGAEQVVGNQEPEWHNRVEFNAKLRLLDESNLYPALAIGYDSQGHGNYNDDYSRYDIKSKGFYGVLSKNYLFLGNLGFHLGLNYSLEKDDDEDGVNLFCGFDKSIGQMVGLNCEYDLALNDNEDWKQNNVDETIKGLGRGYMNAGLDVHFTENLIMKVSFYDILQNRKDTEGSDRTISLLYYMSF